MSICKTLLVAAAAMAIAIPAFAEETPPVSLSKGCQLDVLNSVKCPQIRITGRVDSTTIRKVVANRGNCLTYVQQKTGRARYYSSGQLHDVDETRPPWASPPIEFRGGYFRWFFLRPNRGRGDHRSGQFYFYVRGIIPGQPRPGFP